VCPVLQADCLPDPSDVFLHLAERDIGRDHALLYEAYATYLELKGNFHQAELVYQDGINRWRGRLQRLHSVRMSYLGYHIDCVAD
jgi:checkpoint serine/threonine-protein kinase